MAARLITFASLLFGAEVAASWWVWGRTPTDTIRVWYSGYWAFEVGRMHYWVPVFASVLALWSVIWYALLRRGRPITRWLFSGACGVALEVVSSVLYWRSPQSSSLRGLYQSVWVWNRVQQASERGLPSFRVYLWDHLVPWTIVVLVGVAVWVLFQRRMGGSGDRRDVHQHQIVNNRDLERNKSKEKLRPGLITVLASELFAPTPKIRNEFTTPEKWLFLYRIGLILQLVCTNGWTRTVVFGEIPNICRGIEW